MTIQEFFEKVKGKKIKNKNWTYTEWFIPKSLSGNIMDGISKPIDCPAHQDAWNLAEGENNKLLNESDWKILEPETEIKENTLETIDEQILALKNQLENLQNLKIDLLRAEIARIEQNIKDLQAK
jgi:hypothetical protein